MLMVDGECVERARVLKPRETHRRRSLQRGKAASITTKLLTMTLAFNIVLIKRRLNKKKVPSSNPMIIRINVIINIINNYTYNSSVVDQRAATRRGLAIVIKT